MQPVSVIVTTYNQPKLLVETVDSILSQTYPVAEVVIVDDGSSDDTATVVRKMPNKVKYHYKANGGICSARNDGARLAAHPYIAFCDHDDLWREDKLAKQMHLHEQVPELQYSFTNFAIISGGEWASSSKLDGAPAGFFDGCKQVSADAILCESSMYERLLQFQPIWPSTILMTADFFERVGKFNESFGNNPSEDLEFSLRCLQLGPVGIILDPCVGVRKHSTNFSKSNYRNTLGQIDILRYALIHHAISEATKEAVRASIQLRRIDASHGAFELQEFDVCRDLLNGLPSNLLTTTLRAKRLISSFPRVIAKPLHYVATRSKYRFDERL